MTAANETVYSVQAVILGPEGSPYEGGRFLVQIVIPREYPFRAPTVQMLTPILHLNVNNSAVLFKDCFQRDQWAPFYVLVSVRLLAIFFSLSTFYLMMPIVFYG
jgi:ubiquitin-conjugating enzyme E2 D/E